MTELLNTETGELVEPLTAMESSALIGIYILVDEFERALYVGASRDIARRVGEHRSKRWWRDVADLATIQVPDWASTLRLERGLIQHLAPRHNKQSNSVVATFVADFFPPTAFEGVK